MQIGRIIKIFVKFALWISAFLFVAYLAVLLLFPKFVNIQGFKVNLERQFFEQTGLYLNVEKIGVDPAIRATMNLDAHHVVILYPDKKEMLKAKDLTMKIKILPIIFKKIEVEKIVVERPILSISVDKKGNCSLDRYLGLKYSPKDNRGFVISENFPEIILNRYRVKIFDDIYTKPFVFEGEKMRISKLFGNGKKIVTKGILSHCGNEYLNFSTNLECFLTQTPQKLFKTNPFRYLKQYEIGAKINSKLKIEEGEKSPKIIGQVDISDLKFVLNGNSLKNNFINLKFREHKIDVDADVKASVSDRIKLSGTVNIGNNFAVDLKCMAQNINLNNLKMAAETLLNAVNIKNPLNLYSVNGRANFDFKIKNAKNRLYSSGIAEIIDASVKGKNIPCSITNINSKINFANDTIKIEPTKLLVNDTPIEIQGHVNSSAFADITVMGKNLSVEKLSKFVPDLKLPKIKGIIDFNANLKGDLSKPETLVLADLKNFEVFENGKILTKFSLGKIKLSGDVNSPKGTLTLSNAQLLPTDFSNLLKANNLTLNFDSDVIEIPENKLYLANSDFLFKGKISDYSKKRPSFDVKIDGNIDSHTVYRLLKNQKGTEKFLAATKGKIGVVGDIKGFADKFSVKAEIMADKDNYISCLVIRELLGIPSVTRVNIDVDKNNLVVNEFSLNKNYGKKDKIMAFNGSIENLSNPRFNKLRVLVPNSMTFALSNLNQSQITVKSDILLNGSVENPSIQGDLEVKNVNIPEYKIYSKINKITFASDCIKVNLPDLKVGNSFFDIETVLPSKLKQPYVLKDLKLKSSYLDLNEISEIFENVQNNPIYPGVELPIKADRGFADIKVFKIGGLQAENITSNISINNNVLSMQNINGSAYGGSVSGKSEYNFLKTLSLLEITGKNAEMSRLFKALTGKDDGTIGQIDYKLKLSSVGTKYLQQLRTSKGYMEYTATKGVMGPLGQFEHFLHAQNLISDSIFKTSLYKLAMAIRPKNTGVFTVSKGKTEILNGVAILKKLTVEGPNMSLFMTGKVNLLNDVSDIKIYGRISQDVENALGSFAMRSSQTILTTSSQTSIGNIFYDDYNTKLPKSVIDAIPPLNPNSGMSSRPFVVVIKGSPDNIKSVKSFKWIVDATNAPSPVLRDVEVNKKPQPSVPMQKQDSKILMQPTNQHSQQNIQQPSSQQNGATQPSQNVGLPSFMDNLPNNIN